MRVLVCGGRKFCDKVLFRATMSKIHTETPITMIIHGGATGADWLAKYWGPTQNIEVVEHKADWSKDGRGAGPRRNAIMLKLSEPELIVAFPGGPGTADMVRRAKRAGVKVVEVTA